MVVSDLDATMEMVLPLLVTDVMQSLEDDGLHPEADFTERLRAALLKVVPDYPNIEQDIWPEKKAEIIARIKEVIEL